MTWERRAGTCVVGRRRSDRAGGEVGAELGAAAWHQCRHWHHGAAGSSAPSERPFETMRSSSGAYMLDQPNTTKETEGGAGRLGDGTVFTYGASAMCVKRTVPTCAASFVPCENQGCCRWHAGKATDPRWRTSTPACQRCPGSQGTRSLQCTMATVGRQRRSSRTGLCCRASRGRSSIGTTRRRLCSSATRSCLRGRWLTGFYSATPRCGRCFRDLTDPVGRHLTT